jgi:hypothetical protein
MTLSFGKLNKTEPTRIGYNHLAAKGSAGSAL